MSQIERMTDEVPRLGPGREFDLIRRILRPAGAAGSGRESSGGPGRANVVVGPGDDCAVVRGDGIAVSMDLSVEEVHFRREWLTLEEVGYRAATAALSDLAAVAARPIGVLASVAGPDDRGPEEIERIMAGVRRAVEAVGGSLLGGDVARSPGPLLVDVTALGESPDPVLRSGAVPGDEIWVTGSLGGAGAAVSCWHSGRTPAPEARAAFATPTARTREARWLVERAPLHAMIDLSDGLASDAAHLAAASGACFVIELDRVPVHVGAHCAGESMDEALRLALAGGEDYELCFCAPAERIEPLRTDFESVFGVPLTRVGYVREGAGVYGAAKGRAPQPLALKGYGHFERVDE